MCRRVTERLYCSITKIIMLLSSRRLFVTFWRFTVMWWQFIIDHGLISFLCHIHVLFNHLFSSPIKHKDRISIDWYTWKQKQYIHTYTHACIHTHTHTCIHRYIHTYIHTYVYVCTYTIRIHTCIHTYMHSYVCTYVCAHTHTHTNILFFCFLLGSERLLKCLKNAIYLKRFHDLHSQMSWINCIKVLQHVILVQRFEYSVS